MFGTSFIVVDFAPNIKLSDLSPNLRVALRSDSCTSPHPPDCALQAPTPDLALY